MKSLNSDLLGRSLAGLAAASAAYVTTVAEFDILNVLDGYTCASTLIMTGNAYAGDGDDEILLHGRSCKGLLAVISQ